MVDLAIVIQFPSCFSLAGWAVHAGIHHTKLLGSLGSHLQILEKVFWPYEYWHSQERKGEGWKQTQIPGKITKNCGDS